MIVHPHGRRVLHAVCAVLLLALSMPGGAAAQPSAEGRPDARVVASGSLLDDAAFRAEAGRGLDALYDMRFAEARRRFDALAAQHPGHPAGPFLQALVPWWQILNDLADESRDRDFLRRMDEVVRLADRRLRRERDDPDALFLKGAALGFRARLRANRRDYVRAARDGRAAMDYVLAVYEREPRRADYGFGRGVYDYYVSALREDYPRIRPVLAFFPHGSRQRGLSLLERTFVEGDYLQAEAAYNLAQLYYLHERDAFRTMGYVSWLRTHYPNNAFFHTFEGRALSSFGRAAEAERVWRSVLALHSRRRPGYGTSAAEQALYYLARGAMGRGDYGEALGLLHRLRQVAGTRTEPSAFAVLARLRQGMAHDARGERAEAVGRYREVLRLPDRSGAHEQARRYLERPYHR